MLKRKRELNYRRASERFERCKYCARKQWTPIYCCGTGKILRCDWRCEVVGLESSKKYSIQDDHVCDAYKRGNHGD